MAKSVNQIITEMDAAQAAEPALVNLNSPSSSAIYTLMKYIVALAHSMLYSTWDFAKADLNQIALSQIVGTRAWYVNLALNYNGGTHVQRANCRDNGTKVILKVAKYASGQTSQLSNAELSDVKSFVNLKKVAGTDIDVISQTADLVSILMSVQYTGVMATVEAAVKLAIKDYISALPFDAILSKSLLQDHILSQTNVLNAYIDEMKVDYGLGYNIIPGNLAEPDAGYFEIGKVAAVDLITLNMYL